MIRDNGLTVTGLVPRRVLPGGRTARRARRRSTTTGARSTRRRRSRRSAWCSSPAGCRRSRRIWRGAREMVRDGLGEILDHARSSGVPLAIEPMHPMYCADRGCVNTLAHALDLCDELAGKTSGDMGVAVDVYHVWWDPDLAAPDRARGRQAAARVPSLRLAGADDRPPLRPRHDGRRRDRHPAHPLVDGGGGLPRHARGGDLLEAELVEARSGRGARRLPRAAPDGMCC